MCLPRCGGMVWFLHCKPCGRDWASRNRWATAAPGWWLPLAMASPTSTWATGSLARAWDMRFMPSLPACRECWLRRSPAAGKDRLVKDRLGKDRLRFPVKREILGGLFHRVHVADVAFHLPPLKFLAGEFGGGDFAVGAE